MDKSSEKPKQACQVCSKKFGGMFSSEHSCKRCQRAVCKQCKARKKVIFTKTSLKPEQHRCCDLCWPDSEAIANYIKEHALAFNSMSRQGKQWSELANIDTLELKVNGRSSMYHGSFVTITQLWQYVTPSMREFVGNLIQKMTFQNVEASFRYAFDIAKTYCNFHQFPFALILFLMGHCDQKNSIKIFQYLSVIAQNVSAEAIAVNITLLANNAEPRLSEKQLKMLINYSKNIHKSLTSCFFVDCLRIDSIHYIILQTLLSGDCQLVQLVVSCLLFNYRGEILGGNQDQKGIKNYFWQNCTLVGLQKSIKSLRKFLIIKGGGIKPKQKEEQKIEAPQQMKSEGEKPRSNTQQIQSANQQQKKQAGQNASSEQALLRKLNQAAEFIQKLQSNQLHEQQMDPQDLQSLQQYLDLIIHENDESLKQCEQFDSMLAQIEQQLYLKQMQP